MTQTYVAFLRGINVGGKSLLKMDDLKKLLTKHGLKNIKTILASGNVVFQAQEQTNKQIGDGIEQAIKTALGRKISVIIRSEQEINDLVEKDPFAEVPIVFSTRTYISFLQHPIPANFVPPTTWQQTNVDMSVLSPTEIREVFEISDSKNSTDIMSVVEKTLGKSITTRTWSTIMKVQDAMQSLPSN